MDEAGRYPCGNLAIDKAPGQVVAHCKVLITVVLVRFCSVIAVGMATSLVYSSVKN